MGTIRRRPWLLGLLASLFLALVQPVAAQEKLRVLIIDGQSNHNWKAMTPPMKDDLQKSGRFTVDVATTPEMIARKEAWRYFHPDFS
jgi:hypothetical protein